jgi:bifunctional non-homologous end joining protein LigD
VAGPFWAIANVAPPSSKAAVRPIRADPVMIFSRADSPNHRKNIRQDRLFPDPQKRQTPHMSLAMSLRERTRLGLGIIEPCLPSPAKVPPSGPGWIHETKHDGFRVLARRDSAGVRLITRAGNDVAKLPVRSCLIDGEAIVCDENGLAVFDLIRRYGALASAVHCVFDLLELDGRDLRREPIKERKRLLAKLLRGSNPSIVLNEQFEEDGAIVFREACKLGCEGIVSKRLGSPYRSGRSPHWVKVKNPNAPAMKREAEEDWER